MWRTLGFRGRSLEELVVVSLMPRRPDHHPRPRGLPRFGGAVAGVVAVTVALQLGQAGYGRSAVMSQPSRPPGASGASASPSSAAFHARHAPVPSSRVGPRRRTARLTASGLRAARSLAYRGTRRSRAPRWRLPARAPARLRAHPERLVLGPVFVQAAQSTGVPPDLLEAVAWQESGWQNNVVSRDGALGVGQLLPVTVSFTNGLLKRSLDPGAANDNIVLSARYLAYLLGRSNGDVGSAVAAYAQGMASLKRDGMHPDTKQYVADVLALRSRFVA